MASVRKTSGSMLVLAVCLTAVIFLPVVIFMCQAGPGMVFGMRAQESVEAACKLAAMDISRVVVADPEFGFVSLSANPPAGKATLAQDGQPLPVVSINTIVGTLRQNAIIADELQNSTMESLVDKDLDALESTVKELNSQVEAVLEGENRTSKSTDPDGKAVYPLEDVQAFLEQNIPRGMHVGSIKLTPGFLGEGSETITPIPQPVKLARLRTQDLQATCYPAFTDFPVGKRMFSFAGLGTQTHLVSPRFFCEADGKHICSVVKIECELVQADQTRVRYTACAQAYSKPESGIAGALTLRFSGRPVAGLLSWAQFLSPSSFHDNAVTTYDVVGGDFPLEKGSRMRQVESSDDAGGTSQQFAEHLYYWLKNGKTKPHLDSVLDMVAEPFCAYSNQVYTYEFGNDGGIVRKSIDADQFMRSVTGDGEFVSMADTRVCSGPSAIIFFRDSVRNQDIDNAKHGGQPLAGYPLTSVQGNIDPQELVARFANRANNVSGLAVDIEIGGIAPSTAANDIALMRSRTRNRRI